MRKPCSCITRAAVAAALVSLTFAPGRALAGPGLNLAWNHCLGEGTGVQNATFACDVNTGSQTIVASMILPADLSSTTGILLHAALASASATLPEWWKIADSGMCRAGALNVNMVPDPANVVCQDWSGGVAEGGFVGYCYFGESCATPSQGANVATLIASTFVLPDAAQDLSGGTEYFLFNIVINHQKTTGTGACAGCDIPVCIVFQDASVDQSTGNAYHLTDPAAPGSNFVTWQGGGIPSTPWGIGCPAATPTQRATWGRVKALYR